MPPGFASSQVQDGYSTPVGVIFSADGRQLFVWDKAGRVWMSAWNGATYIRQATPVVDISEEVGNWGDFGLQSVCLDPDFSRTGLLYLFYTVDRHHLLYYGTPQYNKSTDEYANASISRVTRYQITNVGGKLTADDNSRRVLLGESKTTGIPLIHQSHAGGTLLFGRDGTLLVSTGDNASFDGVDVGSSGNTYYQTGLNDGIIRPAETWVRCGRSWLIRCVVRSCALIPALVTVCRVTRSSTRAIPGRPGRGCGHWACGIPTA